MYTNINFPPNPELYFTYKITGSKSNQVICYRLFREIIDTTRLNVILGSASLYVLPVFSRHTFTYCINLLSDNNNSARSKSRWDGFYQMLLGGVFSGSAIISSAVTMHFLHHQHCHLLSCIVTDCHASKRCDTNDKRLG